MDSLFDSVFISWFEELISPVHDIPAHVGVRGVADETLRRYDPNVATTEGKAYNFHVRITAPPFNDGSGANDLVWNLWHVELVNDVP
jgi:hypothetical protein